MDGFINLLKPPAMTSSDAVLFVRKLLPRRTAVGHGGTLDPDAAGVLPICVGKATRLFDFIIDKRKTYIGELYLGVVTDTCDSSGKILEECPVQVSEEDVCGVLGEFTGMIWQIPPMYSALKMGGKKLYELARKGETVDVPARQVMVHSLSLLRRTGENRYLLKIECGKGTYIRSLMRDIGERLGCGGHMSFLLRAQAGAFTAENALTLEQLRDMETLENALLPMDFPLGAYPRADVREEYLKRVMDGQPIKREWLLSLPVLTEEAIRIYVGTEFAGMGEMRDDGSIALRAMLLRRDD